MHSLQDTYKNKRVFVTGHTGFKGGWLVEILSQLGAVIKGYALAPEGEHNLYTALNIKRKCESVIADICNKDLLKKEILDFQPDFIFHLAAQPLVRLSYEMPTETFNVNVMGTAHVLDAVRFLEKPCQVILITTDKVYHNQEWQYPYRENDRLGGYDPYSASKACAELIIDSYRNSFFNPKNHIQHQKTIASTRAGNVIGGGDWAKDRLIPDIVRALQKKEKVIIRNPQAVRPWQHVLEPLSGYLLLGSYLAKDSVKYAKAYNFGPQLNDALSVEEMVNLAIHVWQEGSYEIQQDKTQPHEAGLLKLDICQANAELTWKPRMNAQQALEFTLDWYKQYYADRNHIDAYTRKQIEDFFKL